MRRIFAVQPLPTQVENDRLFGQRRSTNLNSYIKNQQQHYQKDLLGLRGGGNLHALLFMIMAISNILQGERDRAVFLPYALLSVPEEGINYIN
jgi:hypothetical protein